MKEVAGNKGKPQNKGHFMGVKQGTEHVTWRVTQMQLIKTILQPHKTPSSNTTKHPELTVLKQTRKQQQLHQHKEVQAPLYRYVATDNHNQPHNFKNCWWDHIYTAHRKNKLHTWLAHEEVVAHQEEHKQNKQRHTQKSKSKETGNKKERVCERTLIRPLIKTR